MKYKILNFLLKIWWKLTEERYVWDDYKPEHDEDTVEIRKRGSS